MNFAYYGGRRHILVWAVFIAACFFLAWGKISGLEWIGCIAANVAAYITGNTMQHNNQVKYDRTSDEDNKA